MGVLALERMTSMKNDEYPMRMKTMLSRMAFSSGFLFLQRKKIQTIPPAMTRRPKKLPAELLSSIKKINRMAAKGRKILG